MPDRQDGYDPGEYPPFAVTVDIVLMTVVDGDLRVLLIQRGEGPFEGDWALPGGFVLPYENLDEAAGRELLEETGIRPDQGYMEQLGAYGEPYRDPRMRVVTVAYWAIAPRLRKVPSTPAAEARPEASMPDANLLFLREAPAAAARAPSPAEMESTAQQWKSKIRAGGDAAYAEMVPLAEIQSGRLSLAFDHRRIVDDAVDTLRARLETTTIAQGFCPPEFTIRELQEIYEAVWGTRLDAGNFYRDMVRRKGSLTPTESRTPSGEQGGRPAKLWRAGESPTFDRPYYRSPGRTRRRRRRDEDDDRPR